MTREEVQLKVTADTQAAVLDMQKFNNHVKKSGKDANDSFLHASSGAREFKKLLHEVMQDSPLLGLALKATFSSIGAAFMGATMAASYFSDKIKEINKRLDEVGEKNAKSFGDPNAARKAMAERLASTSKSQAELESEVRAGPGPISKSKLGLSMIDELIGDPELRKREKRGLLGSQRDQVAQEALAAEGRRQQFERAANNPAVAGMIARAESQAADLRKQIEPLKDRKQSLISTMDTKVGMWGDLKERWDWNVFGETSERFKAYEKLEELKQLETQLKKTEDRITSLKKADQENTEGFKKSQQEVKRLTDAIKHFDAELFQLGPNPPEKPALPFITVSNRDPATGGIAYHPITDRGLKYKPLRGAPGYINPLPPTGPTPQQNADTLLGLILDFLRGDGIPVTGKD